MHDYRYNDVWITSMIEIFKQQSNDSLDVQQNLFKIELMIWLLIKCNPRT